MKKISLKCKVILTILPLLFSLMIFYPIGITLVPENKIPTENDELKTSQDAIFDRLYLNYTFTMAGSGSGFSNFSYSHISGNDYHVYWDMFLDDATWDESLTSREISNSVGSYSYGDGNHAPIWIFTNSTLGNFIQIAVDGSGDHVFNVTREYAYNLQGFGTIDVWQLEDLTFPGGLALYEKSTGFLIEGFFATSPVFNYTLDFITTNLVFTYTTPDSGIFDGFYIEHNYSVDTYSLESNISYIEDPIGIYNVTWSVAMMGSVSWNEEIANRTMFNSMVGGSEGAHTLVWIHTNVDLSDILPIMVDGEGDQNFEVIGDSIHKLIGFGYVEVWILQSSLYPASEILCEKSTGLILEGFFVFSTGNYTLKFVDTNANFTYVGAPDTSKIPGYNHLLLIGFLIVVPIIILRIKKRK
ncbi:MAG: hypothetical protein ACFFFT_03465 [Candidatus Thorarchaeota archaeon]